MTRCSRRALLALFPALLLAQKQPVTLDDVLRPASTRGFGAVTWAPSGERFLYRDGDSVWLYDIASKQKKELVSTKELAAKAVAPSTDAPFDWENRRVAERTLDWSASGQEVLIAAGGDVFLHRLAAGVTDQLTATEARERDPKLSPDGKQLAFRRGSDLYAMDLASKKVTRLTHDGSDTLLNGQLDWVYPEELNLGTAYWWSPDSTRIAYMQFDVSKEPVFPQVDLMMVRAQLEPERYPKAGDPNADVRIGVVAAAGGATKWLDLGDPRDQLFARVDWLPDSKRVAVQRLNRVQNRLDLVFSDAASGTSATVLTEQDPYWVNVGDELRFLDGGKSFLWSSERSGFRHLYLYSIDGKLKRQLTKGEWEVTILNAVDEASKQIYFTANADSPVDRQLYRVSLDGGLPEKLSIGKGTHVSSVAPNAGAYLDTYSSLSSPPRRVLRDASGKEVVVWQEADPKLAEKDLRPTEIVEVKAADGAKLYAKLTKPAGFDPSKKYPAIVVVYGGPHVQAVRDSWAGATWEQWLAHRGFVIWQLDNRGSSGRGHRWESAVFRNFGAKELDDQKQGIAHLTSLGFVDPKRIGMYGWSFGGYMTLFTMLNAPKLVAAGVAGAPVTNWRLYDTIYTERYMGMPGENPEGYKRASPVNHAANLEGKLMLVHNFGDDNVHFQNTLRMADALERAGKQFDLMVYTQKAHGVTGLLRRQMIESMTAFFERHLKAQP